MSRAPALILREGDRERLAELARLPSVPSGLAKRARMVLLAAEGMPNAQIARVAGVSRPTVIGWRDRYEQGGIKGLEDEPRSGRPAEISEADVVVATLVNDGRPPERLGVTRWSARFLAAELGISFASVARIWRKQKIQPHRLETFKFSTDPELEAKIRDVAGLYLAPPEGAVVVSVDEKSQVQAWTALRRCCRCGPGWPPGALMTTSATAAPPPPAPSATPPADGPAAALRAALNATPGATAAQIAAAAGTSRIVAGQELAAFETSGLATRIPGTRDGRGTAPATWQPAPQPATSPAPAAATAGSVGETDPAGTADVPTATPSPQTTRAFPHPAPARDRTRPTAARQRQPPSAAPPPVLRARTRRPPPRRTAGALRRAQAPPRAAALMARPLKMTHLRRQRAGSRSLCRPVRRRC
jgi:transposase